MLSASALLLVFPSSATFNVWLHSCENDREFHFPLENPSQNVAKTSDRAYQKHPRQGVPSNFLPYGTYNHKIMYILQQHAAQCFLTEHG